MKDSRNLGEYGSDYDEAPLTEEELCPHGKHIWECEACLAEAEKEYQEILDKYERLRKAIENRDVAAVLQWFGDEIKVTGDNGFIYIYEDCDGEKTEMTLDEAMSFLRAIGTSEIIISALEFLNQIV